MKKKVCFLNNEKGSVLVIAVIFLMLLTVIGTFATTTSMIEVQISGNDKIGKMVFYAADSGIHYVAVNPDLYGSNNLTESNPFDFPDPLIPGATYSLSNNLQVEGTVTYSGTGQMPAGTGFSAGLVFAIHYDIESNSTGPNNGADTVETGFYRIGL